MTALKLSRDYWTQNVLGYSSVAVRLNRVLGVMISDSSFQKGNTPGKRDICPTIFYESNVHHILDENQCKVQRFLFNVGYDLIDDSLVLFYSDSFKEKINDLPDTNKSQVIIYSKILEDVCSRLNDKSMPLEYKNLLNNAFHMAYFSMGIFGMPKYLIPENIKWIHEGSINVNDFDLNPSEEELSLFSLYVAENSMDVQLSDRIQLSKLHKGIISKSLDELCDMFKVQLNDLQTIACTRHLEINYRIAREQILLDGK